MPSVARTNADARTGSGSFEADLSVEFARIRDTTSALCSSLEIEDCVVQSMPDASPLRWHLGHTTWFFEQFVLAAYVENYRACDDRYGFIFNSYYQSAGSMQSRESRGVLSRPTVAEVIHYRRMVDDRMQELLDERDDDPQLRLLVTLGLNHEQQHQELMLTDIKHAFSLNPLLPSYRARMPRLVGDVAEAMELKFVCFDGGEKTIGADAAHFAFDNEFPRHRVLLEPFALANRPVTNGEYLEFIRAGGYRKPQFWLADGWEIVARERWRAPLYWGESLDSEFTLSGVVDLAWDAPVCHVSYFEADAFARWSGNRLPTEAEWEAVAANAPLEGNLFSVDALHPLPAELTLLADRIPIHQLFGDVWEWTASAYSPYPGFRPLEGGIGEYNGKFMSGRMVLRGGSCVTPDDHIRASYRNYFYATARWQFSGVRLAQ